MYTEIRRGELSVYLVIASSTHFVAITVVNIVEGCPIAQEVLANKWPHIMDASMGVVMVDRRIRCILCHYCIECLVPYDARYVDGSQH